LEQSVEREQQEFLNEVNTLPLAALDATTNSAAISNSSGGKLKSRDNTLTVAIRPDSVPATDNNNSAGGAGGAGGANSALNVKVVRKQPAKSDPRSKHNGMPVAYTFELTAKKGDAAGTPVTTFQNEVALIWNVDLAELRAAGVHGWPIYALTYDEQTERWVEIPSWWNEDTSQLVALTSHFTDFTIGAGLNRVKNYVPTLNGYEVDLQSGAATASYPIDLPAGPGGFGPKVSLTYNSANVDRVNQGQQGPSSVGWGWSLSTSYIAAQQHHFGSLHPWTVSIVSDGASGDLIKGQDGYWHTGNESFAKIQYDEANKKWEAWDASGTRYVFDLTAHVADPHNLTNGTTSIVINRWMLRSATDTHGNTINYSYYYEEKDGALSPDPITDLGQRTRAVYPREITYGGAGNGIDKVKVTFHLAPATRSDITSSDTGGMNDPGETPQYQGKYISRIDVSRMQQADGQSPEQFRILRSYTLNQDYSTVLGPNSEYSHLTLRSITPWGKVQASGAQAQLPTTTFEYYGRTADMGDWGHLYSAKNGYGGEVRFYYDRAAVDMHESYRRVSGKRIRDGLAPVVADEFSNQSLPHDALSMYEYRGATPNGYNITGEGTTEKPLHPTDTEFRGYAWVREIDPSGQAVDHYFNQDDYLKAKEWRSQVGKEDTYSFAMNASHIGNSQWTYTGHIDYRNNFTTTTDTHAWKVWADPATSFTRTGAVFDGQDVASRFYIAGANDSQDPQRGFRLIGTWKLVNANGNGEYWGLKISRRWKAALTSYEYHATTIWKVAKRYANGTYIYNPDGSIAYDQGERILTDIDNPHVVRPFRLGPVELRQWYTVRLHTSPDGRFSMELGRDDRDHIIINSRDTVASNTSATIPLFPTGQNWKFVQETTNTDGSQGVEPGYQFMIDSHTETRTVYSQSDTWYVETPPVAAVTPTSANYSEWRPGRVNNASGMVIHLSKVQESWSATYGHACCQLGQYLRTMTHYEYNDAYRNLTAVYEYGNLDVGGDERTTYNGYYNLVNLPTRYLPGLQQWTHVYKGITNDVMDANWMLNTVSIYDGSTAWNYISPTTKGDMVETQRYNMREGASTAGLPSYVSQKAQYDAYGNQQKTTDANNHDSPVTTYDPYYHAFPVMVTHPNGRTETTVWDYTLDVPKTTTDMNNVSSQTEYDEMGRPKRNWIYTGTLDTSTTPPNEEYFLPGLNQTNVPVPFSIKYKLRLGTQAGTNEHTWQTRWFDGRGRAIQDVSPKVGTNTVRVDTAYNVNGQVDKATLPFEVSVTAPDAYRVPTWTQPYMWNAYDGLGRTTWQQNPDNTRIMTNYLFLQRVDVWDELNHGKFTYTDAHGRLSTVLEYDSADPGYQPQGAPNHIATEYTYDVLNNLTSIKRNAWASASNAHVLTTMEYDGLGRKKAMNDPDMGRWEYGYDNVGNLTSQKDALYLSNSTLYANRLLLIDYDAMSRPIAKYYGQAHKNANLPDVRFYYDNALTDATATMSWGRLRKAEVTGADGQSSKANSHSYVYNTRGQLASETINSALARNNGDYTIGYQYDTAGRLDYVTYPDPEALHEQVDMTYNHQAIGLPVRLDSNKDNGVYPVEGALYNALGQLTELNQGSSGPTGNLLKSAYTYDDSTTKRGWLTRSLVTTGGGATLLDLNMTYEANGNVKTVSQNAGGTNNPNNPTFTNTFTYDQKDRLVSATSTGTNGNPSMWATETYTFDDIHRMRTRGVGGTTYTYGYPATSGTGSHLDAPIEYRGSTYEYDANGNQIRRSEGDTTQVRTFDLEGRIEKIVGADGTTEYIYDANGQRLIKKVSPPAVTTPPTNGLRGEYYSGVNFTNLKLNRYDSTLDFDWGGGSPDPSVAADNFSVRWRGSVQATTSGTYTFYTESDDGVRLWVNGQLLVDNWTDHAPTENSGTISLTAGQRYDVLLDYYERGGGAVLKLRWLPPGGTKQIIPASQLFPPGMSGLKGEYYDNQDLTNLKMTRYDSAADFNWYNGSPDPSMGADTFSVRWTGRVKAGPTSGTHTFSTWSDDGVRLWVNGQLLINDWTDHGNTQNTGSISLQANQEYEIKLEYYDNGGGAEMHLWWQPAGGSWQVVPSINLLAPATVTANSTIYIGGMYEEDITPGSSITQYTSYYTFGGKLVGMRRVVGTTSTQYRMVGDHLGSTSLIVDAQNTPAVVQRTYNKPYGEVAWSWSPSGGGPTSLTSIGYTGQRLEAESGLMFYNARFYDPVLSFFVSADTISPNMAEPKTRHRYNYVVNNPLKYTDPSGHQADPAPDPIPAHPDGSCAGADAIQCQIYQWQLSMMGIEVEHISHWDMEDLALILEAIGTLMYIADWDVADFRAAMGIGEKYRYILLRRHTNVQSSVDPVLFYFGQTLPPGASDTVTGETNTTTDVMYLNLYDYQFTQLRKLRNARNPNQAQILQAEYGILQTVVHELAHVWDAAQDYELSGANTAAGWSRARSEAWAEAVEAAIYPRRADDTGRTDVANARNRFREYRRCTHSQDCLPYPSTGGYPRRSIPAGLP
jgi:RHS repeat-associated protein